MPVRVDTLAAEPEGTPPAFETDGPVNLLIGYDGHTDDSAECGTGRCGGNDGLDVLLTE